MKGLFATLLTVSLILCASCAHSSISPLVGGDRDEHGCIGSAGYTWSYALHDCVRLWEAGTSFDAGPERVYLIFSPDSTYAEIFGSKISRCCVAASRVPIFGNLVREKRAYLFKTE